MVSSVLPWELWVWAKCFVVVVMIFMYLSVVVVIILYSIGVFTGVCLVDCYVLYFGGCLLVAECVVACRVGLANVCFGQL